MSSKQSRTQSRTDKAGAPQKAARSAAGPAAGRPRRLTAAAALAALEGVALAAAGVFLLVMGVAGKPDSPQQAVTGGVTVLALAALPLTAARGLWQLRRWGRGPAVITQVMALPVAWTLISSGGALIAAGVVLALVAVAALVLLVNPTATEALGIDTRRG
ncbi:hypothetical protein ACFP1Z_00860 [Streptomyces gamaensis]|uniref:Integral membrane protein n=1 Tax=Streptomyces gamaensis TaxID=1763542 RepID=A0ABW0YVA9_9ACTN